MLGPVREKQWMNQPGIFDRNAVAFIVRKVIKGLNYIHSKGYVHTQLSATNVFMDEGARVKIGGLLHARRRGSKWGLHSEVEYLFCLQDVGIQRRSQQISAGGLRRKQGRAIQSTAQF